MKKRRKNGIGKTIFVTLISFLILLIQIFLPVTSEPPKHFGISGYIYKNGGSQAAIGTNFRINNTITKDSWQDKTEFTPFPGWYSYVVNGSEGNSMILHAWNASNYGEQAFSLAEDIEKNVYLNTARPVEFNMTIISPQNSSLYNITEIFSLNLSVTALGNSASNCDVFANFNSSIIQALNGATQTIISLARGSTTFLIWNFTSNHTGVTDVLINYSCPGGGIKLETNPSKTLSDIQIEDKRAPVLRIIEPEDGSHEAGIPVVFRFNVSDISNILNCSFQTNTSYSVIKTTVENGQINNFTISMNDSFYLWNITCYDDSPWHNLNTTGARHLILDTESPHFKVILPNNAHENYSRRVEISANVSENIQMDKVYAAIFWKENSERVNLNPQDVNLEGAGIYSAYFYNTTEFGWYNFSVFANDTTHNSNLSITYFFYEEGVDLKLNSSSMNLIDTTIEYSSIPINVTVFNTGNLNASNVNITIFENSYPSGKLMYSEIKNITAYSFVNINTTWTAKIGQTAIIAVADPPLDSNGSIFEYNESNNRYENIVSVDAYNIYYGNTSIDVLLSTNNDFDVITWRNSTSFFGNIYAVDSDSVVYWSGIQALGMTKDQESSPADFEILDNALNMTGIMDSINNTYQNDGIPLETKDFAVYGNLISEVPVVNSTSSGIFKTGILWETADGGNSFDGTQDIIFVGSINDTISGGYGLQDYELKVPARLREYIKPNIYNSIDIYIELR